MAAVPARLTLVTLGVADVRRATAFYTSLGWEPSPMSVEGEVTFFATGQSAISLYGHGDLAADAGDEGAPAPRDGYRGITLALNFEERGEVDHAVEAWVAAGGSVARSAREAEWGGHTAFVTDLDGHLWELAWNPGALRPDGRIVINDSTNDNPGIDNANTGAAG